MRKLVTERLGVREETAKEKGQSRTAFGSGQISDRRAAEGRVSNSAVLKEKSDPDGTRTRVPAVKGRCPRPLDDGASGLKLETAEAATSKP